MKILKENMIGQSYRDWEGTGTFTKEMVCGNTGLVKLEAFFDADTGLYGTHRIRSNLISRFYPALYSLSAQMNRLPETNGKKIGRAHV